MCSWLPEGQNKLSTLYFNLAATENHPELKSQLFKFLLVEVARSKLKTERFLYENKSKWLLPYEECK